MTKSLTNKKNPNRESKNSSANHRKPEVVPIRQSKRAALKHRQSQKENRNSNLSMAVTDKNSNCCRKSPPKQTLLDAFVPDNKRVPQPAEPLPDETIQSVQVKQNSRSDQAIVSHVHTDPLSPLQNLQLSIEPEQEPQKKQMKSVSFAQQETTEGNPAEAETPMGIAETPPSVMSYIKSHELLANNPIAVTLVALAGENTRDHAVKQLQHALYGTGEQCPHCQKFICPKYAADHIQNCQSKSYRIQFAQTDGHYFCYLGCGDFSKRESLISHMLLHHKDDKELLKKWGLSYTKLELLQEVPSVGDGYVTQTQMKPISFANQVTEEEMEPVLLQYILSCVDDGHFIETLEVDSAETFYYEGKVIRCWYIDFVRSNKWILMELAENLRQLRNLRSHHPALYKYSWFSFFRDSDTIQLVFHQRAKTAIGWCRKGNYRVAQKCFASTLKALKAVHSYGRFQGGISPSNIACTENGEALLTVWAYSALLSKPHQRIRVDQAPYWREHGREQVTDIAILDLLALLYSYSDLIHYSQEKPLPSETLRRIFWHDSDAQWQFFKRNLSFSGTMKLNSLLIKYTEATSIAYDALYQDLQDLFRPQPYMQACQLEKDMLKVTRDGQSASSASLREDLIRNQILLDDWMANEINEPRQGATVQKGNFGE